MLSIRVRNWCVCSACASVPDAYAQHTLQFLTRKLSMVWRDLLQIWNFYAYAEHTRKKLVRMLSIRISSWPVCSGYASVPGEYAQHFLKGMRSVHALVPDAYAQCTHQFLNRMLSIRFSSWRACSVHASIPYAHAEGIHNEHLKNTKTDAHAEHAHQALMRMLSMRIRHWCACSWCASVPDAHAQGAHQFLTRMLSMRIKVGACA